MSLPSLQGILQFGNQIFASVNVIVGFSLFLYVIAHNRKSQVALAFCAMMAFITVTYLVDLSMAQINTFAAANVWLRLQWLGIALLPAAYFQFASAVLDTTGATSRRRRAVMVLNYVLGAVALAVVIGSDWLVAGVARTDFIYHLVPGPGSVLFGLYYIGVSLAGWGIIRRARARTLTTTSHRRMSYLMLAVIAPTIGVFPYLLIPTTSTVLSAPWLSLLTLLGNMAISLMTIVIGYSVAYQGVLLPDRVIKHRLIHFLLRGPLVAILVVILMLAVPRVEVLLGLPRDTVLIVAVAGSVVLLQLIITKAKSALDLLIYRSDSVEIGWIQSLDQRLLTTHDLEQLLENILIAFCERLRSPSGLLVTMQNAEAAIRVFCGPRASATTFLASTTVVRLLERVEGSRSREGVRNSDFRLADGHWILPLRSQTDGTTLGILGAAASEAETHFCDEDLAVVADLIQRAEMALEDMNLQQQIFGLLQRLDFELDQIQAWRSRPSYAPDGYALQHFEANPINLPEFVGAVKDALAHYWGGPKLSASPLVRMMSVRQRLPKHGNVPAKAVRSVLQEAIERLRPEGSRSMTDNAWTVYNILELRFLEGRKIKDVARVLAMSESDYYRKQRVAIQQLSETLVDMERATQQDSACPPDHPHS